MEVVQLLHMKGGVGKTSYATNSLLQAPKGLITKEGEGLNNKSICAAKTNRPAVYKQYFEQFAKDFTVFLRSRAEELVPGGSRVLTTMGSIKSQDPLCIWEVVGLKLSDIVLKGLIEEDKLNTFNLPYFAPTTKEVEDVIEAERSFTSCSGKDFSGEGSSDLSTAPQGIGTLDM